MCIHLYMYIIKSVKHTLYNEVVYRATVDTATATATTPYQTTIPVMI